MSSDQIRRLIVNSQAAPYTVTIGANLLSKLSELVIFEQYSKIAIVVDENVQRLWLETAISGICRPVSVFSIPAGERNKTIDTLETLWRQFSEAGLDRASLVLCLGGGVTTDIGGFAAATYMRGLAFVHLPTTLLAQVDAAIGGKVGINFIGEKNLVGVIESPLAVIADTSTLSTLEARELRCGYAEMIKHALAFDRTYAEELLALDIPNGTSTLMPKLVAKSIELKSRVVTKDERENGLRRVLNLGHTTGHVFEAMTLESDKPLAHGEAVSVGLVAEARIAEIAGLLSNSDLKYIKQLLGRFDLPLRLEQPLSEDEIVSRLFHDKKMRSGVLRWPLLNGIGSTVLDVEVPLDVVRQGIRYVAGT